MHDMRDIAEKISSAKLLLKQAALDLESIALTLEGPCDDVMSLSDILEEVEGYVSEAKTRAIDMIPHYDVDPETKDVIK